MLPVANQPLSVVPANCLKLSLLLLSPCSAKPESDSTSFECVWFCKISKIKYINKKELDKLNTIPTNIRTYCNGSVIKTK